MVYKMAVDKKNHSKRTNIIKVVTSPLSFFTLTMLIIEAIFLSLSATGKISEWIPFTLMVLVLSMVFIIALFKSEAFYKPEDRKKKSETFMLILNLDSNSNGYQAPSTQGDFAETKCTYSINDVIKKIIIDEPVIIHTDLTIDSADGKRIIPYIHVPIPPQLEDPSIGVIVNFKNHSWKLPSCRIKLREVFLS